MKTDLTSRHATIDDLRGKPTLSMAGLLVVEMVIGYEWFISGLLKFVRGDFPSGLADELLAKSDGVSAWYGSFLKTVVVPVAQAFGYAIETSEVLAGIALIVGPLIGLWAWDRVSDRVRRTVLFFTAAAAIGGAFLAINLHLANGASHPWLIPGDAFDEGIDLDSVLPAIQIVIATVSIILFRRLRRQPSDHDTPRSS
ncbi:MAG: hypothetical protein Q8K82_17850 [Gemmatimonadaceae bacterium]|nr:hypothetical protein [Gemmatimonadaceae bacterium]